MEVRAGRSARLWTRARKVSLLDAEAANRSAGATFAMGVFTDARADRTQEDRPGEGEEGFEGERDDVCRVQQAKYDDRSGLSAKKIETETQPQSRGFVAFGIAVGPDDYARLRETVRTRRLERSRCALLVLACVLWVSVVVWEPCLWSLSARCFRTNR